MKKKILYILLVLLILSLVAGIYYFFAENKKNYNLLMEKNTQVTQVESSTEKLKLEVNDLKGDLEYEKSQVKLAEKLKPYLFNDTCNAKECVFVFDRVDSADDMYQVAGSGIITGYYQTEPARGVGEIEGVMCDQFVVISGAEGIVKYYKDLVALGNTVNEVKEDKLIINLSVSGELPDAFGEILKSTEEEQISISMLKTYSKGPGRFAPPCYTTAQILEVI